MSIVTQIKNISILLSPIIPISTNKILDILNLKNEERLISAISEKNTFDYEQELKKAEILFKKIDNDN